MTTGSILFLPGDGIGPEVMGVVRQVIDHLGKKGLSFELHEDLVGGASLDAHGVPITEEVLAKAKAVDAIMFGAVGVHKYDANPFHLKPEQALLKLRKQLELFANLRPAIVFDALVDASTLKPELVRGLDILILRELTGGVYFGEPRGIEEIGGGQKRGVDTQVYTTPEIERIARVGFELARKRGNAVTSVEKANVMHTGVLWRQVVTDLHAREYGDVQLSHMYADNCAMQLIRRPKQFDVIVTDNLFGDILSDAAAMATGSLGMLPSAALGAPDAATGKRKAMYEPIHGSAPDIAGKDMANPIAALMSFAMLLKYSFDRDAEAQLLEAAIADVLNEGYRTADIAQDGMTQLGTVEMGQKILTALTKRST
ncbi:3-isopropylmalate dehydrogenase [Geminicoccus roseus]|uniref:3-isopropylmalate dehydrogenase n=1 Tax=Geminicoccus roseus TaxID=404900 RepID=UPI00041972BA|nr:3-isopropylmalate dehydrogenase [Geminicoccus roseus]